MTTAAAAPAIADRHFRAMGCDLRIAMIARPDASADAAVERAMRFVHAADRALTRFSESSELARLGAASGRPVEVSGLLAVAVEHAVRAAERTGGLLDPTLAGELAAAGYATSWETARRAPLADLLRLAPPRHPAGPHPARRWREIHVDRLRRRIDLPAGLRLDLAATAKGLVADLALRLLGSAELAIVDLAGDLAIGGDRLADAAQPVLVADPFGRAPHPLELSAPGGVATSSIAGRCWIADRGAAAHHLLDPATGRPAFTGLVQATAAGPSAADAEVLAGHALLAGPDAARTILARHGGVLVHDDGGVDVIDGGMLHPEASDDRP